MKPKLNRLCLPAVLFGVLIHFAGLEKAQGQVLVPYTRADTYSDFALANDFAELNAAGEVVYFAGYGPIEDLDGDGLTNRQEWEGYYSVINGERYYFGWRITPPNLGSAGHYPDAHIRDGSWLDRLDSSGGGVPDYVKRELGLNPQSRDTDGDGMWDAWEIYVGLDPRDNGLVEGWSNPHNRADADPDGDGLTNMEEFLGPNGQLPPIGPATSPYEISTPSPQDGEYTLPLNFDTDGDHLIDSFEYQQNHGLNPFEWDDKDADPDQDGLTTFREQLVHPLLSQFWQTTGPGIPSGARVTPPVFFGSAWYGGLGRQTLIAPGYMNLAQYNHRGNQWPAETPWEPYDDPDFTIGDSVNPPSWAGAPYDPDAEVGGVLWGHPVVISYQSVTYGGTRRWTSPLTAYTGGGILPDGWSLEHGLNPFMGSVISPRGIEPSGALGDPDGDGLLNWQEYVGQDGYRIDRITGTGDESNPWITRVVNRRDDEPFGVFMRRSLQPHLVAVGSHRAFQSPNQYLGIYTEAHDGTPFTAPISFTNSFDPANFPGFFDAARYYNDGDYVPIAGAPPPVPVHDETGGLPRRFNPFAVTRAGFLFQDVSGSGYYDPATDNLWYDRDGTGTYIPVDDPLLNEPGGPGTLISGTPGRPITANAPIKWPMPGYDTDWNGLPDFLEIQMDVTVGKQPSSPVHPADPFTPRSAMITGAGGIPVPNPDPWDDEPEEEGDEELIVTGAEGRRLFSRDFTVEAWVYLTDQGADLYHGSFVEGRFIMGAVNRATYQLGVTNSIPYIAFETLGGKRYEVQSAAPIRMNRWVHLAGVFNHADNALSLYLDGFLQQSLQVLEESSSSLAAIYGGRVWLGRTATGSPASFVENLWIDEVRIWGIPRSPEDVAENLHSLVDPYQPVRAEMYNGLEEDIRNGLLAYFPFDDGGPIAADFARRAQSSLLGYDYPADDGVFGAPRSEYLYPDVGFGLDSDEIANQRVVPVNTFIFDANRAAPVRGMVDGERGAFDSVGDRLPDSWKLVHEMNPFKISTPDHVQAATYDPAWAVGDGPEPDATRDFDGDGLNALYEYWSRTNPRNPDTNADGIPDGDQDFDGDGIPNRIEQLLGSRPDLVDTDDDGIPDGAEQAQGWSPINSLSPEKELFLRFDGNPGSFLEIPERVPYRTSKWTIEARVIPAHIDNLLNGQSVPVLRRVVERTQDGMLASTFELRVARVNNVLVGQVRYVYVGLDGNGRIVSVTGNPNQEALNIPYDDDDNDLHPSVDFTHLAGTYDEITGALTLYVNGSHAAQTNYPARRPPVSGRGPYLATRVGEGFKGIVDDIRIWDHVRTRQEIEADRNEELTGTESGLLAYFRLDDGGWPARLYLGPVLAILNDPDSVTPDVGDRYIVGPAPVGEWLAPVDRSGQIAEWGPDGEWLYTTAADEARVYVQANLQTYEFDRATETWTSTAPTDLTIIPSVLYGAPPATPVDGDTWQDGANIVVRDSMQDYPFPAPASLFSEGAMLIGAAGDGDFAWWVSREQYYRYDEDLAPPAWKRWGRAIQWLSDARVIVEGIKANEPALLALAESPRVGDWYFVESVPALYLFNGGNWTVPGSWTLAPVYPEDRILDRETGELFDWAYPNAGVRNKIADASTDDGRLYVFVRNEGVAYRSRQVGVANWEWQRWGFIPSSEDFTTRQNWNDQWDRAARISGGAEFFTTTELGAIGLERDSDGDGLPDWWEIKYGLDPFDPTGDNGAFGDPDGDGLWNINEYRAGLDPTKASTFDDGVWDGDRDSDGDGLSNLYEQNISGTRVDMVDTDDDGLTDWEEVTGYRVPPGWEPVVHERHLLIPPEPTGPPGPISDPLNSLDPPKQLSGYFGGDGHMFVRDQRRHELISWTIHAWVRPQIAQEWPAGTPEGVIIRRGIKNTSVGRDAVNYELGVHINTDGEFIPYARYAGFIAGTTTSLVVQVDGTNPSEVLGGTHSTVRILPEEWTHLAATYDPDTATLSLYINGRLATYRRDAFPVWGLGIQEGSVYAGELTIGGGPRTAGVVTNGFVGHLDEVMIVGGALNEARIQEAARQEMLIQQSVRMRRTPPDLTVRQLPLDQALSYEHQANQLMVRFAADIRPAQVPDLAGDLGLSVARAYRIAPVYLMNIADDTSLTQKIEAVRAHPDVLYAEPNYRVQTFRVPNDPMFEQLWGLRNTGEGGGVPGMDIDAVRAWSRTVGSRNVQVAVIDTGIDYTHQDIAANMWINPGEVPGSGQDESGTGYIDDYHGYDFADRDSDPMDVLGHGTHVAGTIGAVGNNGVGIVGVNWNTRLMALKMFSDMGWGTISAGIEALEYAWMNNARISNNSWGFFGFSQAMYDAIAAARNADHLFVAAAGNWGLDADVWPIGPGDYDLDNIINVAAMDRQGRLTPWSNYGKNTVHLAAPGASILSTTPGNTYSTFDGTSMAAPHVAGTAALLLSVNPNLSYHMLRESILGSVDPMDGAEDRLVTGGRLNAYSAVTGVGVVHAYFTFDDGGSEYDLGETVEDFTTSQDWENNWSHAGRFAGDAGFSGAQFYRSNLDSNNDGIPDWWYRAYGFDPHGPSIANEDFSGNGLINYYEYLAGTHPLMYDTNGNGTSDAQEDPNNDGLTNLQKQELGLHPLLSDTDDDGISDYDEIQQGTNPRDANDPEQFGAVAFDGSGRLLVRSEKDIDNHSNWTLETWVRPANDNVSGIILRRAERIPFQGLRWIDYELGLDGNVPYISYAYRQGGILKFERVDALRPIDAEWTHVAAVMDDEDNQLRLFVNGKRVAYQRPVIRPPIGVSGGFETTIGGGHLDDVGNVTGGFEGEIDAVRVWAYARTGLEIQHNRGVLLPEFTADGPDSERSPIRIFNFNTRGVYAHNSRYTNDWLSGYVPAPNDISETWLHAAQFEGGAQFVDAVWPPLALDSDDDGSTDHEERTSGWEVYRSESPLIYRALSFDADAGDVFVDELVDNEETGLYALTNWTVEAWVRPIDLPVGLAPVVRRETKGSGQITLELGVLENNGAVYPYTRFQRDDAGREFVTLTHNVPLSVGDDPDDWTHIAATFKDGEYSLFVNGGRVKQDTLIGARPYVGGAGGRVLLGSDDYIGHLQEVRIWNAPRTHQQIRDHHDSILLFSAALLESSFQGGQSYLGRDTEGHEDGLTYDHSRTLLFDTIPILWGHRTHKFSMAAWIKMDPGAQGGILVERKVDLMLVAEAPDWRPNHRLRITDEGFPRLEWQGQVRVYRPIYEDDDDDDEIEDDSSASGADTPPEPLRRVTDIEAFEEVVTRNLTSEVDIRDGQWHHIAVVGDGRRIRMYINGTLDRELPTYYNFRLREAPLFEGFYWTYMPRNSALRIADDDLEAVVDEVMFWNEDLTQDEIRRFMRYGLTKADIMAGLAPIDPLPENAVDPEAPRQRLISYVTFDGELEMPWVPDRANAIMDYRILPQPTGAEIITPSTPPILTDRIRTYERQLRGYFTAMDGGEHVENYMERNNWGHSGLLRGSAEFVELDRDTLEHLDKDSSGDGMPDWWKSLYGLDPGSSEGIHGPWGDPDGDGLPNIAEYLAGTDPLNWDTAGDGFSDYDSRQGPGLPTYGWLYTDRTGMAGEWQERFPLHLSPLVYDAHRDPDGDGWSNFAEFMADTNPTDVGEFPRPLMNVRFKYDGPYSQGPLRIYLYDSPSMDGVPIAVATAGDSQETSGQNVGSVAEGGVLASGTLPVVPVVPGTVSITAPSRVYGGITFVDQGDGTLRSLDVSPIRFGQIDYESGAWSVNLAPSQFQLGRPCSATWSYFTGVSSYPFDGVLAVIQGHLREGNHWAFAFIDRDGTGEWNPGDPAGLAQGQPINVSWGDIPTVTFGLTDKLPGYPRFRWEPVEGMNTYTVRVRNVSSDGGPILLTRIIHQRNYLHEGDIQYGGYLGLEAYNANKPGYQWRVYDEWSDIFSMDWTANTLPVPTIISPVSVLRFARNDLEWEMDKLGVNVYLEIRAGAPAGPAIFNDIVPAPHRKRDGTYALDLAQLGIYAGDQMPNGDYYWRMRAVNPRRQSSFTDWQSFTVNLSDGAGGAHSISGEVHYFGPAPATNIVVQAFRSPGFSGRPDAQVTLTAPGPYKLMGLRSGTYYVRAFINQNPATLQYWESWGFVKDYEYATDYEVKPITVPCNKSGQQIVIRDRDTNNNDIPDAWEYAEFGLLGHPNSKTVWDNQLLWMRDSSGDGLSDGWKLQEGLDPDRLDTWEDGIPDALRIALGMDPTDPGQIPPVQDLFIITGITLSPDKDIITYDVHPNVPILATNVRVYVSGTSSLNLPFMILLDSERVITTGIWEDGPWEYENMGPLHEMMFYGIDWKIDQ